MSVENTRLVAGWLLLALSACGGQSGNEGSWPAAPCARGNAFVIGRIEEVGEGCVSVRVERVVAAGEPLTAADGGVLFDGDPQVGGILRGRLGTTYAYDREFERDTPVALFVESWGDDAINLEVFPFEGDRAQVRWARQRLQLTVDEMNAMECQSKLAKLLEGRDDDVSGPTRGETSTAPPAPEPTCGPATTKYLQMVGTSSR